MPTHGQAMVSEIAEDSGHTGAVSEETDSNYEIDQWIRSRTRSGLRLLFQAPPRSGRKKIRAASEASRGQNGSPVEGTCGYLRLVMSGYARVGYRCRCAQAAMERRLSSKEAERQCLYQRAMAARRPRQYMLVHTTLWIFKLDLIKYISEEPAMTGRVARGQMILIKYDIQYSAQKVIKGSVLSDYLAQQPIDDYQPMKFEFPDEDISSALVTPKGSRVPFVSRIAFECADNVASTKLVYRVSNLGAPTGATPFSWVYGMEAVLPVEVQIPSLRVLMDVKLQEAEWVRTRHEELSLIEEKRLSAICHGQLYQQRMKCALDRKVRPRVYHVGNMVLKRILPP
ncbi:hypothetical protein KIW84_014769 [Lathyrus oleraceus]|uniref:Uncharacterized protein n=1 Tax=Pisum sativum TaxID=3888 RepID=A0A9D5GZI0_PEA|nr:hypothetical protein KIW84_014769 [Pisum sativum]